MKQGLLLAFQGRTKGRAELKRFRGFMEYVILKLRENFEAQGREGWTDLWVDSDQLRCGLNQRLGNRS